MMKAKVMKDGDFMLNKLYKHKSYNATKQKGLVLFLALIALVAMSLAAAALVRSVDSGVLAAGNLAFKQSAIMSAETGIARAYTYINGKGEAALQNPVPADGYFATFDGGLDLKAAATWANSALVPADAYDLTGNEARYILQRMCRTNGKPDQDICLVGTGNAAANSKGGKSEGGGSGGGGYDAATGNSDAVAYRLTVRVAGPKNTVSYLQAFIY
jgi:type IV pilus assembly protein PilX